MGIFEQKFFTTFLHKNKLYIEKITVKFSQIYLTSRSTLKINNMIYQTKKAPGYRIMVKYIEREINNYKFFEDLPSQTSCLLSHNNYERFLF